ncbi:C39 family peptidase [Lactobacillus mulieris]|uniref:C39 family peptidase n=1 Tax=Lactobacillus mulieris TaxID=2508708 RepID=A0AAP3M459_9LACO|nr:C39 family peptidase [Lactobacillus mulieris]MCZ3845224.1 C39 family peptidase [Lactobacillus mulieris]MCZ3876988.1 C39 family peptidase [Lactobacillus mulieris]MCZ3900449.1 C39 family peptidase [Lactobacillus mulieris]
MKKFGISSAFLLALTPLFFSAQSVKAAESSENIESAKINESVKVQPIREVIKIKYNGLGGVAVWKSYSYASGLTGSYLGNNTRWQAFAIATNTDGTKWYNLGGNQWVKSDYVISDSNLGTVKSETNQPVTSLKPENAKIENQTGVVKIKYDGLGGVAVWKSYDTNQGLTGQYLPKDSSWQYFKVATTNNGTKWYNLGGNQWVKSDYVVDKSQPNGETTKKQEAGQSTVAPANLENRNGVIRINYNGLGGVAVWKSYDTNQGITGHYLSKGSSWQYFKVATMKDGTKWYNLGGNQWVKSDYAIDLSVPKKENAVQKSNDGMNVQDQTGVLSINYSGLGGVAVWKNYDTMQGLTGSYLRNGSSWQYFKVAVAANGAKWYNLGGNQWVMGQYVSLKYENPTGLNGNIVKDGNRYIFKNNTGEVLTGTIINGKQTFITDPYGGIYYVQNDAPVISQLPELPTGCEMTAVTMMLQYAGANVSKLQVANETPRSSNGNYGFVGSPYSSTGWWVFPTGIAPVVNKHLGTSQVMTGASIDAIKDKLIHGHLVVVWVANMNGFINHALTLTGYNNNGTLYYNNPWTGKKESMSVNEFMGKWTLDQKRALSY